MWVSPVQERQAPPPNVRPDLAPGPQSWVSGVKPGAVNLEHSLLGTPGLLKEAIVIQTDHSINEALLRHQTWLVANDEAHVVRSKFNSNEYDQEWD